MTTTSSAAPSAPAAGYPRPLYAWYAMGVMIYEALTGEAPFQGSIADVMVQKKTLDAPKLSGTGLAYTSNTLTAAPSQPHPHN